MQTKLRGIQIGTTTEVDLKATRDGDLKVAQYLPQYAMLCAAGKVFAFDMSAGVAKAPVVAMPTTSPEWGIYNANAGGGAHIVLLQVAAVSKSGTLGMGLSIVATSAKGAQTAVTANYTSAIVSCLDGSSSTPNAYITNNPTLVGGTPAWVVLDTKTMARGGVTTEEVTMVGAGVVADAKGLIIAPPGGLIGIEVVGLLGTTALFSVTIVVAEVQLDT